LEGKYLVIIAVLVCIRRVCVSGGCGTHFKDQLKA
jgi:hypothetical protein